MWLSAKPVSIQSWPKENVTDFPDFPSSKPSKVIWEIGIEMITALSIV